MFNVGKACVFTQPKGTQALAEDSRVVVYLLLFSLPSPAAGDAGQGKGEDGGVTLLGVSYVYMPMGRVARGDGPWSRSHTFPAYKYVGKAEGRLFVTHINQSIKKHIYICHNSPVSTTTESASGMSRRPLHSPCSKTSSVPIPVLLQQQPKLRLRFQSGLRWWWLLLLLLC